MPPPCLPIVRAGKPSASLAVTRDKYYTVYDRVLCELWPVPVEALDVKTRAGTVRTYRAGYRYIDPLARTRPVLAVDPLGDL